MVLLTLMTAGACAQRANQPLPPVPAPAAALAAPAPQPVQPTYSGPLTLHEVRVIETAGQRSVLFRFSRPPEGVDYFPLRGPSRLVIDVKGPIDPLPKVHSYKAADALVGAVRVGTYQGRMRLVVDVKGPEVPQFSVDNYDTLVTAFLGEKASTNGYAESNAQVLFISDAARNGHRPQLLPAVAKSPVAPVAEQPTTVTAKPATAPLGETKTAPPASARETSTEEGPAATENEEVATGERGRTEIAQATPPVPSAPAGTEGSVPLREESLGGTSAPAPGGTAAPAAPEFGGGPTPVYTGRRISLDFKNADIHDVLRILADVSGLNIVATDDVRARVTLRLVEVPWDQALDVIMQANGLEKTQVGNVITVSTTRRLEAERNARLAAQNAQQRLAPLETEYVKVNYVKAEDVVRLITQETQQRAAAARGPAGAAAPPRAPQPAARGAAGGRVAIMSPRGTIAADPTTNVVIIRDVRENIAAVRELIRNIDVQTPQVMIESYIVTANENLTRDLGIQWGYRYLASPETGNPTGVNFPGRIGLGGSGLGQGAGGLPFIADFPSSAAPGAGSALDLALGSLDGSQSLNLRLSALEREGKARVISRPRVVTLNNRVADIRSRRVVRVPIVAGSLTVGGAGTTGGGNAFQEFDVGITLKVTPQISSDGFVLLDIDAESSELTAASVTPSGTTTAFPIIPDTLTRTASSNVLIRAGDTFVLGGILQDSLNRQDRGVPYLRDVPGLGWLFQGRNSTRVKDELLVFITPKLVAGVSTTGLPTAQQLWENRLKEGAQSQAALQP
ncbi:MAG: type IV pilus secretin PilQ [Thermodesulfobacteriota bacterium]